MGQVGATALSVGGSLIGAYFGGPIGAAVGGMAGGLLGSVLFAPKPRKPLIADMQVGNASYGNPIPILFGTARLNGTMIWQSQVKTTTSTLGKGGGLGGAPVYHYHQNAAFGFCEGPAKLVKIWLDGKLFFDLSGTQVFEYSKHKFTIREHTGDENELPDPLITSWVQDNVFVGGAGNPAYRGLAYLVMEGVDLINYGNRFPQVTAEWTSVVTGTTIFKPLIPPANDPDPDHTIGGLTQVTPAVDWVRGLIYEISDDNTIRVFNAATQQMVLEKTVAQWGPTIPPPLYCGIACGQGSFLYVYPWSPDAGHQFIYQLDPNTLTILQTIELLNTSVNAIYYVVVFTAPVPATGGTVDMLVVVMVIHFIQTDGGSSIAGYIIDTGTGISSTVIGPNGAGGFGSWVTAGVGLPDPTTGVTEVWFAGGSGFDPTKSLYVWSASSQPTAVIAGSASPTAGGPISAYSPIYTLTAASFGQPTPTAWDGPINMRLLVDPSDGAVIFTNMPYHFPLSAKWSPASGVIWTNTTWFGPQNSIDNSDLSMGTLGGSLGWNAATGGIPMIDLATGLVTFSPIAQADESQGVTIFGGNHYNSVSQSLVFRSGIDGRIWIAFLNRPLGLEYSVATIIRTLCERVGMTDDMIDVSRVTATTQGYIMRDTRSAGAAIADLCQTYQLDMVESDYTLKFVPRGQTPVATIAQVDLGSIDANDSGKFWEAKAAQEQDMPLQVNVKYLDPALDYQPGAAYARRTALPVPTMFAKRKQTVDLGVIATNLEARRIAENWLYTMWAERFTYETVLSAKYLWLDPTDNVTVVLDSGTSYTARIENIDTGADLSLKLALASEDITSYVPSFTPGVTPPVTTPPTSSFANLLQFNLPLLQDSDATPGNATRIYFAVGALSANWGGGVLYHSTDGVNWPQVSAQGSSASWGRATTALGGTVAPFCTDYSNTVTINLTAASSPPVPCAYSDLMNGANPLLIGQEILQYQNVTDNADGSYTLSALVRGRRGTEWAVNTHAIGDIVILLRAGELGAGILTLDEINLAEQWKLVPGAQTLQQASTTSFIYRGYDLKPYAPIQVSGIYTGSDVTLHWVRRTRIGGALVDGSDTAPLGETVEGYEIDIMADGTATAVVKRTLSGLTSPTATYTAAQIAADWGTAPGDLWVRVFQLSSVVGRGFSHDWHLDLRDGSEISDHGDVPVAA